VRRISDGAHLVLSTGVLAGGAASVVGAGIGREVVRTVASRIGLPYVSFDTLLPETNADWLACCAPAVAVGVLAGDELLVRSR
jgi:(4-(4-[2-(gamma-L-glutamylamino)ethyl]phenoxymethyl)furan-2-yl)methanamine synthase